MTLFHRVPADLGDQHSGLPQRSGRINAIEERRELSDLFFCQRDFHSLARLRCCCLRKSDTRCSWFESLMVLRC